ncbi:hypothetical protein [Gimesia sp.]|uniref:hypothetical protein n=1 Tax=Gimesia sp. TaxID=2024833 RepID=UPI003A8F2A31
MKLKHHIHIIIALSLLCFGLIGMIGATSLHHNHENIARFLDHLSAALIVVGLISMIEKIFVEKELISYLIELFKLKRSVHEAGISEAYVGPDKSKFEEILLSSHHLAIVFNDGYKWCSDTSIARLLGTRFANKQTSTEIFLLNPECSFLDELAKKTRDEDQDIQLEKSRIAEKIDRTIALLQKLHSDSNTGSLLEIRLISAYPTYTLFLGDRSAIVSFYTITSSSRQPVPVLELCPLGSDSFYEFFQKDLTRLKSSRETILVAPLPESTT